MIQKLTAGRILSVLIRGLALGSFLSLLPLSHAHALETPFKNLREIAKTGNFDAYRKVESKRKIKVAILDNGFRGREDAIGDSLPDSTVYHAGPVAVEADQEEAHGLFMAQLFAGLLGKAPKIDYELHLFSAYGYSNLEAAVNKVIEDRFDIVLYSQVWEYGGNGDGQGFINALVSRATQAGVIWINAAGNFNDSMFVAPIKADKEGWAQLPGENSSVRVRCHKNSKKKCNLRIVLSWNSFQDDVKRGTDKDLDLVLTDDTLKIIRNSVLTQKLEFPDGEPGASLYPRELIQLEVDPGLYYIRVKVRSENFNSRLDELKITTSGDFTQLMDVTAGETLMPPADHPAVITVGANDTPRSGQSANLRKPDLFFPSKVILAKNDETYKGSSNSAAVAAAMITVLKGVSPSLTRSHVLKVLKSGVPIKIGGTDSDDHSNDDVADRPNGRDDEDEVADRPGDRNDEDEVADRPNDRDDDEDADLPEDGNDNDDVADLPGDRDDQDNYTPSPYPSSALTTNELEFEATGYGCFTEIGLNGIPDYVPAWLRHLNGTLVETTMGPKIFTNVDPFTLAPGLFRLNTDDMLMLTPHGFQVMPRTQQGFTFRDQIEVVQVPRGERICSRAPRYFPRSDDADYPRHLTAGGVSLPTPN